MAAHRARPITVLSGKGGVGKTTLATALALRLATDGSRTLLVSTDPAHSTGDALGMRLGPEPVRVTAALDAVEVDPGHAVDARLRSVADAVAERVDPELWPQVRHHLELARDSPGMVESATFERLAALLEACPSPYERIVADTAPTGHTLRLLSLPAVLSAWVEGLTRQREKVTGAQRMLRNLAGADGPDEDPVLARLHARRTRLQRAGERLRHDTAVWLVLTPQRLAIDETARALEQLTRHEVPAAGLVVNQVLPEAADGVFLAERRAQQQVYLDEIAERFADLVVVTVAQRSRDVTTRDELRAIAGSLSPLVAATYP